VIAKLSQMMRYMIYDTNHSKVLLKKEIEYMHNYISLERLRLSDQTPIEFHVNGNVEDTWITPLIFITFLENAFKHGIGNGGTKSWVKANLTVNGKECVYSVENSKSNGVKTDLGNKSGIGLQNVQRRLELSYPGQYTLEVKDLPERYFVQLNLKLA
jgi:LytS/YehU family sensor histidine kinase